MKKLHVAIIAFCAVLCVGCKTKALESTAQNLQESLAVNEGISDEFYRKVQEVIREKHHYPRLAKIRELQGVVYVEFILNTDGSIEGLKVYQTNTEDILNEQALRQSERRIKTFLCHPKECI